jgi:hypothetical protein
MNFIFKGSLGVDRISGRRGNDLIHCEESDFDWVEYHDAPSGIDLDLS